MNMSFSWFVTVCNLQCVWVRELHGNGTMVILWWQGQRYIFNHGSDGNGNKHHSNTVVVGNDVTVIPR